MFFVFYLLLQFCVLLVDKQIYRGDDKYVQVVRDRTCLCPPPNLMASSHDFLPTLTEYDIRRAAEVS